MPGKALLLDDKRISNVTAQGIKAGGHRGTFSKHGMLPRIGLSGLLHQVADKIRRPILAAGGIHNGKTIKAAFTSGAEGVQIGSAFIRSDESGAAPAYKTALKNASDTDSVLTKSFSGKWARGLANRFIKETEESGLNIPEYPVQAALTAAIRSYAHKADNKDFMSLWAGQSAATAEAEPVAALFAKFIKETEEIL